MACHTLPLGPSSSFTKDLHGSLRPLGKNSSPELCSKEIVKIFNLICTDFLFLQGQKNVILPAAIVGLRRVATNSMKSES